MAKPDTVRALVAAVWRRRFGTGSRHEWESGDMPTNEYGWTRRRPALFGWGLAAAGELGIRAAPGRATPPRRVTFPVRMPVGQSCEVTDVACGRGFSVFAVKGNVPVYGTGLSTSGQLGPGLCGARWTFDPVPVQLPTTSKVKVHAVACGREHVLIATSEGVYSLGGNAHGQCGRAIIEDEDYANSGVIHCIRELKNVKQLACGLDHSLVLTNDGTIYAFGAGTDGQLGRGSYKSDWRPTEIEGDVKGERIVQFSSSGDCVLAVTDKGDVFGWGNNEYKQLQSCTSTIQICTPKKLNLGIGAVKWVAAGGSACAAVTSAGQLYVWGYGILGQGPEVTVREKPSLLPPPLFGATEFEPNVKVKSVYAGLMHFGAINSKGELFMWGTNRSGLLGLGHEKNQYFPFKVALPMETVRIACAPDHTIALCRPYS